LWDKLCDKQEETDIATLAVALSHPECRSSFRPSTEEIHVQSHVATRAFRPSKTRRRVCGLPLISKGRRLICTRLKITFVTKEGDRHTFDVKAGDNLLDIALDNDLEMEGACGGSCACSTCHVIVEDDKLYDKMDEPDDDENDMLDLAFGLTETSRLGCQVKMSKELDGLVVKLPSMTRNLQASDFQS
jgi:ferredoxin